MRRVKEVRIASLQEIIEALSIHLDQDAYSTGMIIGEGLAEDMDWNPDFLKDFVSGIMGGAGL